MEFSRPVSFVGCFSSRSVTPLALAAVFRRLSTDTLIPLFAATSLRLSFRFLVQLTLPLLISVLFIGSDRCSPVRW